MTTQRLIRPSHIGRGISACALVCTALSTLANAASVSQKPVNLKCDALTTPMGLDTTQPQLSWQLQDERFAAKQTAYELQVATQSGLLIAGKPDVWDSGRVASDKSVGVIYMGPALKPEQRYYWRVKAWDKDGNAYPASDVTWWETGLMNAAEWRGKWIGFEEPEERRIRESGAIWITNQGGSGSKAGETQHDFRHAFTLAGPVRLAHLYVTGEDTASAWVNGKQVLAAEPLPPWKHTPWKSYTEIDVLSALQPGKNLLAVEATLFTPGANGAPMSACLYLEMGDGSVTLIRSGEAWKAMLDAPKGWNAPAFSDDGWKNAVPYVSSDPSQDADVGRPWPTGPVKMLRRGFEVTKPVRSARLYATALGAYHFWINGHVVGDQILPPAGRTIGAM